MLATKGRIQVLQGFNIAVGTAVVAVGLFSHYTSDWVKRKFFFGLLKTYTMCDLPGVPVNCPNIAMEHYFISVIIVCWILSIGLLSLEANSSKLNIVFHAVAALLLLSAALFYFVSVSQIRVLFDGTENNTLRGTAKNIAASLAVFQSLLCAIIAIMASRIYYHDSMGGALKTVETSP